MPTTVLVTAAGTATSLNVVRALREQGVLALRLVGADTNPARLVASAQLCDAFAQLPRGDDSAYESALLALCERLGVDVVIPVMDAEVAVVARVREVLAERGVRSLVSAPDVVAGCNDKLRTWALLQACGVPTPMTWLPDALGRAGGPPTWPVIVKPREGVGSADVYRADDAAELAVFVRRVRDPIVQAYVPGEEFTVDVLLDGGGQVLAAVPRVRLQTKAGVSTKGRTVADAELIARTSAVCVAMGVRGPANVQWRRDGVELCCLEINPRFSGGLALTVAAGVNTPVMLVQLCLGMPVAPAVFRAGVTMIRSWSELFLFEEEGR